MVGVGFVHPSTMPNSRDAMQLEKDGSRRRIGRRVSLMEDQKSNPTDSMTVVANKESEAFARPTPRPAMTRQRWRRWMKRILGRSLREPV